MNYNGNGTNDTYADHKADTGVTDLGVTVLHVRPAWFPVYIATLRATGNRSVSARVAGVAPSTVREYLTHHVGARAEQEEALEEALAFLELEARRRAMEGSDAILMFLLRANNPDLYAPPSQREAFASVVTPKAYISFSPDEWDGEGEDGGD